MRIAPGRGLGGPRRPTLAPRGDRMGPRRSQGGSQGRLLPLTRHRGTKLGGSGPRYKSTTWGLRGSEAKKRSPRDLTRRRVGEFYKARFVSLFYILTSRAFILQSSLHDIVFQSSLRELLLFFIQRSLRELFARFELLFFTKLASRAAFNTKLDSRTMFAVVFPKYRFAS